MSELSVDVVAGAVRAIPVPATTVNASILQGNSYLMGWSFRDAGPVASPSAEGSVTSPAAGATIASTTAIPMGEYTINWTVSLAGTVAAADANNFGLYVNSTLVETSVNLGAAGEYPQPPVTYNIPQGATVSVKVLALGTVGAIYTAAFALTPISITDNAFELYDGSQLLGEGSMPTGGASSQSFAPLGIRVYTGINLVMISGAIQGTVNALFEKAR